ncbi:ORF1152 [White spot syndrome virus]|uniref:ORF1152 n=1 Tax=White spot syndrome virus TaxID=342409 RepID=A0A2D3I6B9_9VIRU|nr:ORF1152 [White spot syndrome virus]
MSDVFCSLEQLVERLELIIVPIDETVPIKEQTSISCSRHAVLLSPVPLLPQNEQQPSSPLFLESSAQRRLITG